MSKRSVLEWVQECIEKDYQLRVKNLDRDWADGMLFVYLLHRFYGDQHVIIAEYKALLPDHNLILKLIFDSAFTLAGIPLLLEPQDITELDPPDSLSITTYLLEWIYRLSPERVATKSSLKSPRRPVLPVSPARSLIHSPPSPRTGRLSMHTRTKSDLTPFMLAAAAAPAPPAAAARRLNYSLAVPTPPPELQSASVDSPVTSSSPLSSSSSSTPSLSDPPSSSVFINHPNSLSDSPLSKNTTPVIPPDSSINSNMNSNIVNSNINSNNVNSNVNSPSTLSSGAMAICSSCQSSIAKLCKFCPRCGASTLTQQSLPSMSLPPAAASRLKKESPLKQQSIQQSQQSQQQSQQQLQSQQQQQQLAINSSNSREREEGFFGFDAELREQRMAKFTASHREESCRAWLVQQCGASVLDRVGQRGLDALHRGLKDGVVLCRLVERLLPGCCPLVNDPARNVLQERENVQRFIDALEPLRVRPEERCTAADLHSGRDLIAVVECLGALQRVVETGRGRWDPERESLNRPLQEAVDAGPAVNRASSSLTERGYFGMSAEIQEKIESKIDQQRLRSALFWLNSFLKHSDVPQVFNLEQLMDGVALCTVVNRAVPDMIPKFHRASKIKMLQRENIQLYLAAARALGVEPHDLFSLTDLSELKYPLAVIDNVFALARVISLRPDYKGIHLTVSRGKARVRTPSRLNTIMVPDDLQFKENPSLSASSSPLSASSSNLGNLSPRLQVPSLDAPPSGSSSPPAAATSPRRVRFNETPQPPSPKSRPHPTAPVSPPPPPILKPALFPPEIAPSLASESSTTAVPPSSTSSSRQTLFILTFSIVVVVVGIVYMQFFK